MRDDPQLLIPPDKLAWHKSCATACEIAQQPKTYRATADLMYSCGIHAFLAPLIIRAQTEHVRIIFTGAGTSAFIGAILAPLLSEKLGVMVEAIASTDLVSKPKAYLLPNVPTLLVSFARSGNSPESIGAVTNVDALVKEPYHLVISNNEQGQLARYPFDDKRSFIVTLASQTLDEGFAMTSSASNMMLAALLAFCPEYRESSLNKIIDLSSELLTTGLKSIAHLARMSVERVVFLGSGGFATLGRECALKLLELSAGRDLGFFDSTMGFRHGPKFLVNEQTLVIIFMSHDPYTARYDRDLVSELRLDNKASKVVVLGDASCDLINLDLNDLDDAGRVFLFLLFGQLYAFYRSFYHGISADNPCPTGEVNRVVQGVYLYPYPQEESL